MFTNGYVELIHRNFSPPWYNSIFSAVKTSYYFSNRKSDRFGPWKWFEIFVFFSSLIQPNMTTNNKIKRTVNLDGKPFIIRYTLSPVIGIEATDLWLYADGCIRTWVCVCVYFIRTRSRAYSVRQEEVEGRTLYAVLVVRFNPIGIERRDVLLVCG